MSEEATEGRDYEEEARAQGWAPVEHWKGDPKDFKDAEQFVKDGENIPAILKSKVDRLETRVEQLLDSNKKFHEFSQKSLDKEKKEKEKLIKELKSVRKQAITDGDGEAFDAADARIDELQVEPANGINTQGIDPLAKSWLESNPWYETNGKLAAYADGIADRLVAQGFTGKAYFDELTKNVTETFPDDFGNKNRKKPNTVEAATEAVTSSERGFGDLPKDAKDAFKQFKRDIPDFTEKQFLEQYEWE